MKTKEEILKAVHEGNMLRISRVGNYQPVLEHENKVQERLDEKIVDELIDNHYINPVSYSYFDEYEITGDGYRYLYECQLQREEMRIEDEIYNSKYR